MSAPGAFADPAALAERLARWRVPYGDRPLFRVAAGPRWVRLHLAGDERFCLLLTTIPGATLLLGLTGRLPDALAAALPAERDHPLPALLSGARLTGLAALPGERVACLRFVRPDGSPMHLLHQLFGSPGNTVLLDGGGRCLWATRRPPHALLTEVPERSVYGSAGRHGAVADVADDEGTAEVPDDNAAAALDHLAAVLAAELRARAGAALGRRLRAADKLCAHRQRDLEGAGSGDEHRRRAEALAAHLHELKPGTARCELADLRDGAPLVIDLDPAQSPAANLNALFHRARKAERGREIIAANLANARSDAAALRAALEELESLPAPAVAETSGLEALATLQVWLSERADLATDGGDHAGAARRAGAPEEAARPFRRYLIDGRWEVWVGRSSRENDELTHGAAHSRDLWLHAHGSAGSHVIVRTGGRPDLVPRAVVEKAAALAALHSKARNASLVSVIWTEKRYVRKPRKAPPGLAVCLQDHTVMVAPGIAPGVEPA